MRDQLVILHRSETEEVIQNGQLSLCNYLFVGNRTGYRDDDLAEIGATRQ